MSSCKIRLVLFVLICATQLHGQSLEYQTLKSEMNAKLEDIRTTIQVQLDSIRSENMDLKIKLQTLETKCQLRNLTTMSELDTNSMAVESGNIQTEMSFSTSGMTSRKGESRKNPHTRVAADVKETIAFYAYLQNNLVNPQVGTIIKFNNVISNLGGAYSPNTGVFRCPKAGVYVFNWSITTVVHGQVDTIIKKNGGNVGAALTASEDDTENRGGANSAILELAQGDEIDITVTYHKGDVTFRSLFSSFSGFMMDN